MKTKTRVMTRRVALGVFAATWIAPTFSAGAQQPAALVHKDPNCGCCAGWAQHLKDNGFAVTVDESADLQVVRKRLGVPADLAACHSAEIDGYVVEGHVPALAVRRLLQERPEAIGLAVPGMPAGSPGMEGGLAQEYDVLLFGVDGSRRFMRFVGTKAAKLNH